MHRCAIYCLLSSITDIDIAIYRMYGASMMRDMNDEAVKRVIGDRLRATRLRTNISQQTLAERSGLSRSAIHALEKGSGTLDSLVRALRALGHLDALNAFLPDPGISPLQIHKMRGKKRLRASPQPAQCPKRE